MKGVIIEGSKYLLDNDMQYVKKAFQTWGGQSGLQRGGIFWFLCPSPHCDQKIEVHHPWRCPRVSCTHLNNGATHSIFTSCEKCGYAPYAAQCYECGFVFGLMPESPQGYDYYKLQKFAYREGMYRQPKYPVLKPAPMQPAPEPVKVPEPPFLPALVRLNECFSHTVIFADIGWGKTWLLKMLAYHHMQARHSVTIVDSEGGFAMDALGWRKDVDVIYIDFTDPENAPCLSMFDVKFSDNPRERERILLGTLALYRYVFTSLLGSGKTPNQVTLMEYVAELLLEIPGANLTMINNVLFDISPYRKYTKNLRQAASNFFQRDFPTKEWKEVARQVMNRINSVLANPVLARVFTQSKSKIDLYKAINSGKLIVVNVNRSHLQDAAPLLGDCLSLCSFRPHFGERKECNSGLRSSSWMKRIGIWVRTSRRCWRRCESDGLG